MDTREQLIELLTRLVMDGLISEEQAASIMDMFDVTGELPEGWALPLPFSEAIPGDLRAQLEEQTHSRDDTLRDSPDVYQDEFISEAEKHGRDLAAGRITVSEWHRRMRDLIIGFLSVVSVAGAMAAPDEDALDDLAGAAIVQLAYLSRFADETATNTLSPAQIGVRSRLYAGEGRAIFYQQRGQTNALFGWVEDYIAVDDRNTCGPCSNAEARGPYLPGTGPMPGRICLGRGYCRCVRLPRYDPTAYARLTGTTP